MNYKKIIYIPLVLCTFNPINSKLIQITNEDQYTKELVDNKCMLLEFSAGWCSVCNSIETPFKEIAGDKEFDHIAFAQVDVDKFDNISKQNGIVGVPTFVYVENGNKKIEEIGVQNMPSFKDHLRDNLRKTFKVAQANIDLTMTGDQPKEILDVEETVVDIPMASPAAEPNIFMQILNGIKDFIALVLQKIQEFFLTIVNAIKGFFGQ